MAEDLFYLHEFQQSLTLADSAHPEIEFLSHLALNNLAPIKGLQHSEHPALKSIALFAVFQHATSQRAVALQKLGELAMTGEEISAYLYICALTSKTDNPEKNRDFRLQAISFLTGAPSSLLLALRRQLLLSSGPAASAAASEAALASDTTTISHLMGILHSIYAGSYDEAYYGVSDLILQFENSDVNIAGGIAVLLARIAANIGRGRLADVGEDLKKVTQRDSNAGTLEPSLVTSIGMSFRMGEGHKAMEELKVLADKFPDNELSVAFRKCREVCSSQ